MAKNEATFIVNGDSKTIAWRGTMTIADALEELEIELDTIAEITVFDDEGDECNKYSYSEINDNDIDDGYTYTAPLKAVKPEETKKIKVSLTIPGEGVKTFTLNQDSLVLNLKNAAGLDCSMQISMLGVGQVKDSEPLTPNAPYVASLPSKNG